MPTHKKRITFKLDDEAILMLRPIVPEDRRHLIEGLKKLSKESLYLRFFRPVKEFSEAELDYLTKVDQVNHVAWGAFLETPGNPTGIAVGRYIRMDDQPDTAEFALTVIDEFQNRGIGARLFSVLYLMAREHGIKYLQGNVMANNIFAVTRLKDLGADVKSEEAAYVVNIPIYQDLDQLSEGYAAVLVDVLKKTEQMLLKSMC